MLFIFDSIPFPFFMLNVILRLKFPPMFTSTMIRDCLYSHPSLISFFSQGMLMISFFSTTLYELVRGALDSVFPKSLFSHLPLTSPLNGLDDVTSVRACGKCKFHFCLITFSMCRLNVNQVGSRLSSKPPIIPT